MATSDELVEDNRLLRAALGQAEAALDGWGGDKGLVEAFSKLLISILDNVSIEYMDEMTEGAMTDAIEALKKCRENK